MKIDPNDSAFAFEGETRMQMGLTKREYFAAMAMQGLLAHNCAHFKDEDLHEPGVAKRSLKLADALIAELNKETT